MTRLEVVGQMDHGWAWDGVRLLDRQGLMPFDPVPTMLRGAVASVDHVGAAWRMVRDPYGLGKIYWAWSGSRLVVAARPHRLVESGVSFSAIRALPPGTVLDVAPGGISIVPVPDGWIAREDAASIDRVAADMRASIESCLRSLAAQSPGRTAVVCLSGGIDSALIALTATRCFDRVVAVSFDLVGPQESADRRAAAMVADELGIELVRVEATPDEVLANLDLVLREGVDWRPFNVHAALVNAVLADRIASLDAGEAGIVVLTGDLANELVADYAPEVEGGQVHYRLPVVSPPRLRSVLVRGLESTHREIGVFAAFGLDLVQPYAACIDHLMGLAPEHIGAPSTRADLAVSAFGAEFPLGAVGRTKVRAQVGGAGGGVLGVVVRAGIDEASLRTRFAEMHQTDASSVARAWRTGRFRSSVPEAACHA